MHRAGWLTVLLTGMAMALAGTATALVLARSAATAPQLPGGTGTVHAYTQQLDEANVRETTPAQWAKIARDNAVVVLNSWDFRLIPVLKRANPAVQVWVYKDLSGVRSDDCTTSGGGCGTCRSGVADRAFLSSGMGYCWVKRNHPSWLLGAVGSGRPFQFKGYPETWETDYGNRAYQRQWIKNVLVDVRAHGWDGVKIDNALTIANAYGVAARYPTDAAVQAATYSGLREIGYAFRKAGVRAVANVGYATSFPGLWQRWLGPVDGLEQEGYLSYAARPNAVGIGWVAYEKEVSACAIMHKVCWFHSGGQTAAVAPQTRAYALASVLLATDGRQLLAVGNLPAVPLAPHGPMGDSLGDINAVGRAWRRSFAGGVAIVNPTMTSSVASLGGSYLDGTGRVVSAVSMPPVSGAILRVPGRGGRSAAGANASA